MANNPTRGYSDAVDTISECLVAGPITKIVAVGFTELVLRNYLDLLEEEQGLNKGLTIHRAQELRYAISALKQTLGD